ncbi:hypothetical protein B0I35DRAFT_427220 [Stachybotrys elegans]|uniref:Rhodopsin domain-containing protein n=1 Tax=Stachybotrys elegans TaxID=80388 RepID=A0A8K0WV28_9HYPO|nr:hypothetical protein B0I35DRAFT_427220 [Stachybotrys elegans]
MYIRQAAPGLVPTERPTPPGIDYDFFIGFSWAGVSVAVLFLFGRLYSRFRGPRRLFLDDVFISIACAMVVTTAGLWQWSARDMYHILNVNAGVDIPAQDFFDRMRRWLTVSFVVEMLYYTTLILFKLSMLFFFKRLGNSVERFGYLWWPVLIFSLCTYFVSVGNVEYKCLFSSLEVITEYCNSPEGTQFLKDTLAANCALDVVSDFMIMLIPIVLLWKVRIQWRRKLIFMGIFSLSIVIMGVAIARAADIEARQKSNGLPDSTYLWFWSACQSFLCIVVACSSAFPQLFTASSRSTDKPVWKPSASYYDRMALRFQSRSKKKSDITLYDISAASQGGKNFDYVTMSANSGTGLSNSSQNCILVPEEIGPTVVACYKTERHVEVPENQIARESGYHVTHN